MQKYTELYVVTFHSRTGWWENVETFFESRKEAIKFAETSVPNDNEDGREFAGKYNMITVEGCDSGERVASWKF